MWRSVSSLCPIDYPRRCVSHVPNLTALILNQHPGTAHLSNKMAGRPQFAHSFIRRWTHNLNGKHLANDDTSPVKWKDRRERNFVGAKCAACEESLEHMLRGERILQLQCRHVAHEACLAEYIKESGAEICPECQSPLTIDITRGANSDFDNVNKLTHCVQTPKTREPSELDSTPLHNDT